MTLLIVDGSNVVMRCAFGGEILPKSAVATAEGMIARAARELHASHLVITLDDWTAPTWRTVEYPAYKGNRDRDTSPWLHRAHEAFTARGWYVAQVPGYEADDLIATLAVRAAVRSHVAILSGDSDVLPLLEHANVAVYRPDTGGGFHRVKVAEVCERYDIPTVGALRDFKAMAGESGDHIKGVPGIGPKSAAKLLEKFETLEAIITAGQGGYNRDCEKVATHADAARLALRLVTLREDAPVPPIAPSACALRRSRAVA